MNNATPQSHAMQVTDKFCNYITSVGEAERTIKETIRKCIAEYEGDTSQLVYAISEAVSQEFHKVSQGLINNSDS